MRRPCAPSPFQLGLRPARENLERDLQLVFGALGMPLNHVQLLSLGSYQQGLGDCSCGGFQLRGAANVFLDVQLMAQWQARDIPDRVGRRLFEKVLFSRKPDVVLNDALIEDVHAVFCDPALWKDRLIDTAQRIHQSVRLYTRAGYRLEASHFRTLLDFMEAGVIPLVLTDFRHPPYNCLVLVA